jgi:hypothetical protein
MVALLPEKLLALLCISDGKKALDYITGAWPLVVHQDDLFLVHRANGDLAYQDVGLGAFNPKIVLVAVEAIKAKVSKVVDGLGSHDLAPMNQPHRSPRQFGSSHTLARDAASQAPQIVYRFAPRDDVPFVDPIKLLAKRASSSYTCRYGTQWLHAYGLNDIPDGAVHLFP